jgi:hypothetical protein
VHGQVAARKVTDVQCEAQTAALVAGKAVQTLLLGSQQQEQHYYYEEAGFADG